MLQKLIKTTKLNGFTLVEMLIYVGIFAVSAVFLVGILTVATRTELKRISSNEVNQQLTFAASTIQRLVRESSLIENGVGVSSSTLVLRMKSSGMDPTKVYVSSSMLYIRQGAGLPTALTSDKVSVSQFFVTKYENPGNLAVVQVDLTLDYATANPQAKNSQTWRSAISRVSAATFDDNIVPGGSSYYIGQTTGQTWQNVYVGTGSAAAPSYTFGGDPDVGFYSGGAGTNIFGLSTDGIQRLAINASGTITVGPNSKIKSLSDIVITTSTSGFVVSNSAGSCYRIGVSSTGTVIATAVAVSNCQ
ncbi:type II secretion system protein [Candidatus Jorgensenbacteria bacterium]|nr:type II secretion system protein [Candidatus Jorgensenbacteria bacterium]